MLRSSRSIYTLVRHLRCGNSAADFRYFAAAAETPPSDPPKRQNYTGLLLALAGGGAGIIIARQMGYLDTLTGFSLSSKPNYEAVKKAIADILENEDYDDGSYGPVLVRLAWHASGTYEKESKTGGSNGASMRFQPESDHEANAGLKVARELLEPIKKKFPWISYSDLWTLAGAVAIEEMGGPHIEWRPGRTDAPDSNSCTPDGRLPDGSKGASHLRDIFYRMGFDDREIVALSGAHTLGRCHKDRSGYVNPWTNAPTAFSNLYFQELVNNKWKKKRNFTPLQYEDPSGQLMMLPTDMALLWDRKFKQYVQLYAEDEATFFTDFAKAFSKLMELGVPFPEEEAPQKS